MRRKVTVTRPRLRHVEQGEVTLQSYAQMRAPGAFSEELLEKILRGVSTPRYADPVIHAAGAFGVSPSTVSRKLVELTAAKLKEFQARSLADVTPFANVTTSGSSPKRRLANQSPTRPKPQIST